MIGNEPWWCAVADTEHGEICGRANRKGDCFVPFHGEKSFTNFKYVLGDPETDHLVNVDDGPQGFRITGSGRTWCAIAYTPWGKIPGRVHLFWHPDSCVYVYDGIVRTTKNFVLNKS